MSDYLQSRLDKLDDKVDSLQVSLVRLEEGLKQTHALLIKHDAAGSKALVKTRELEDRIDAAENMWKIPVKWAILLGKIAAAIAAIFGVYKLFRG